MRWAKNEPKIPAARSLGHRGKLLGGVADHRSALELEQQAGNPVVDLKRRNTRAAARSQLLNRNGRGSDTRLGEKLLGGTDRTVIRDAKLRRRRVDCVCEGRSPELRIVGDLERFVFRKLANRTKHGHLNSQLERRIPDLSAVCEKCRLVRILHGL